MQRRLLKAIWEQGAAAARKKGAAGFPKASGLNAVLSGGGISAFSAGKLSNAYQVLRPPLFKVFGMQFSTAAKAAATNGTGSKLLVEGGAAAQKKVATWFFVCSGWVFGMVVVGGMTRLTKSGLSMTDWTFTGSLPPMSAEEWEDEFDNYKESPEYRMVHKGISLDDFKFIYWMEYAHRMMGRALGFVFILPGLYFMLKGYITNALAARFFLFGGFGGLQGLIGWWMVKSGLEEPATEDTQPRVSPYRLALHLTSAFVIYSSLFWTALSVAFPEKPSIHLPQNVLEASMKVRKLVIPVTVLAGLTAVSGAFVAGNDAGRAYNTFPKMGDHWIPPGILDLSPVLRNFFENTATVQLDHRILAITTLCSVGGVWWAAKGLPLLPMTSKLLKGAVHMTILQVALGITALLTYVPVPVGVAHQAGALTLFTIMLALLHTVRRPSTAPTQTSRLMARLK